MIVKRKIYLERLWNLKDKHLIKVVTGLRRSGKSTLLELFRTELLESGVPKTCIQSYNFEDLDVETDYLKLHEEIKAGLNKKQMNYVFLDEIQNVENFEKLLDSLFVQENVDLYVTGSNAFLLSSELATLLSGRQVEINILPLSFQEYIELNQGENLPALFELYRKNGGLPQSIEMFREGNFEGTEYLRGVFNTVILNDIVARSGKDDVAALENILKFLFSNVGSTTTPSSIANYMKSHNRKIDPRKVERLIGAAVDSFILYPVNRFNIKGKELLQTQQKYYLVDLGFRRLLLGLSEGADAGHLLENIVYLELRRRGNQVWVGQTKNGQEVDFVVRDAEGGTAYYQVVETMKDPSTAERELSALNNIDDHNAKYVITLDAGTFDHGGIKQVNALDWLTEEN